MIYNNDCYHISTSKYNSNMIKVKLREVLWDKNITAAEVNRLTGLNKANLSNIMRGKHKNVGLETINLICNATGCTLDELLEYTPD